MMRSLLALLVACSGPSAKPAAATVVANTAEAPGESAKRAVQAIHGHVIVLKSQATFAEYRDVMTTARALDPEVVAAAPIVFIEATLRTPVGAVDVGIKGLPAAPARARTDLQHYVDAGTLPADVLTKTDVPVAIGDGVAKQLGVRVGDPFEIEAKLSNINMDTFAAEPSTVTRHCKVAAIVHTAIPELDGRLAFASLLVVQDIVGRGDTVMGVELRLTHPAEAKRIARKLEDALGGAPYMAQDWCELNRAFLNCKL